MQRLSTLGLRGPDGSVLAAVGERVPNQEYRQYGAVDHYPMRPKRQCPEKGHATQETQEERRIAQWRQKAAQIAHNENKKNRQMVGVLPALVDAKHRPD